MKRKRTTKRSANKKRLTINKAFDISSKKTKQAKQEGTYKTGDVKNLMRTDLRCLDYENRLGLETLRFIKHNHLDPKTTNYTREEVQKMLNQYVEDAEVKFARTLLHLSKNEKDFNLIKNNAEARLKEYFNRNNLTKNKNLV